MIFGAFERMVAMRYLRARKQEGFVSLIAVFSLLGIALGVATLIIVMSVMNGFRHELLSRVLGLNGHIAVVGARGAITDFDAVARQVRATKGVRLATPQIEGQVMATGKVRASGAPRIIVRSWPCDKPTICSFRSYWSDQNQGTSS